MFLQENIIFLKIFFLDIVNNTNSKIGVLKSKFICNVYRLNKEMENRMQIMTDNDDFSENERIELQ